MADIMDYTPEDSIDKLPMETSASGTTGEGGQAWKEGDNKFQQAISAWRSRHSMRWTFGMVGLMFP